ncbi:uncharacterized protein [Apostichopus japonicus]|uniref:uncharacterized protein isoform X3 n=1 Tax=Stichopus japonicus TaxID=307972 RepID=UPI003AB6E483
MGRKHCSTITQADDVLEGQTAGKRPREVRGQYYDLVLGAPYGFIILTWNGILKETLEGELLQRNSCSGSCWILHVPLMKVFQLQYGFTTKH